MTRRPSHEFHGSDSPRDGGGFPERRHDSRHDPLLRAAISGEIDGRNPDLLALLESCSACREQYDNLELVKDLLDGAAGDERELLSDLDWQPHAPGRELVGPFVREQLARARQECQSRPRIPRTWWQTPWVAAAAAGILVAGWAIRGWVPHESELPSSATLGARDVRASAGMTPSGQVIGAYPTFAWTREGLPGGRFHLTVWDDRAGGDGALLGEAYPEGQSHDFSADETRDWPDRIRWEVQAQDAFGTSVGKPARAFAQR